MSADTVPALLARALGADPGRPLVTYYDEGTGERVELSVATTANWVAKTANLLQDSLLADAGTRVRVALPLHWSAVVWHLACWSVGCTVVGGDEARGDVPDVVVCGPEVLEPGWDDGGAADVVALSLRPMAGRFTTPPPAGVVDHDAEVLGHGDVFAPAEPVSGQARLLDRGREVGLDDGERALVAADDLAATSLFDAVLAALVVGGSMVLVRDSTGAEVGPERLATIAATERVSRPPRGPASR